MAKHVLSALLACCLLLAMATLPEPATALAGESAFRPKHPYRIGMLEAGPNWVHDRMLAAVKAGLRDEGWNLWVTFPVDAKLRGTWGKDGKIQTGKLAAALMHRTDLDCIIAMGTEAAQALLAHNNKRTPIVAMTLSDPIASGVVKSAMDSGVPNLTSSVIPNQGLSRIRLFYDVIRFKKLGVIYQNTAAGRTYSNVGDVRDVAREQGFSLLEYNKLQGDASTEQCLAGLKWLVDEGIDSFYVPDVPCFDWTINDPRPLFDYLNEHKIATFARSGTPLVQLGALMGAFSFNLNALGHFHAKQIIAILGGTLPEKVNMRMPDDLGMSLNLETAQKIGMDFSADVLVSTDVLVANSIDLETVRQWY